MGEMFNALKEMVTGKEVKEEQKTKKDIEGWLAFFVFGLYLSIFVILYYTLIIEFLFFKVLSLVYLSCLIYTIILMHKRKKIFKKFAILTLWFWAGIILIGIIYFIFTLTEEQFLEWWKLAFYEGAGQLIVALIISILWTNYLLKSKRVKETFTKN
jgi:hypothetical protein